MTLKKKKGNVMPKMRMYKFWNEMKKKKRNDEFKKRICLLNDFKDKVIC